MIVFDQVSQFTRGSVGGGQPILSAVDLVIPADRRIALLGQPFEHTRTIIDLAAGLTAPSSGRITRTARISYPAGEIRMFISELSVRDNVKHIARLYAADHRAVGRFAQVAMDLGSDFDKPFGSLARDKRKIISHIIAYCIPFQVYLLTETLKRGRGGLAEVAMKLLRARIDSCGLIVPARNMEFAQEFCDAAVLLWQSKLYAFDTVDAAVKASRQAGRAQARTGQG
jgi:capsular polysaccharide transport system ATP-binding protein